LVAAQILLPPFRAAFRYFGNPILHNDPMIAAAATALGIDADALFRLAATLP
jgi:hypothetical protein